MFNMFVGFVVLASWGLALIFVIITLVLKEKKILRWVFGSLTFIFVNIPVVMFLLFYFGHNEQQNAYSGVYQSVNESDKKVKLELLQDGTFYFEVENCGAQTIQGTWEFHVGDVADFIDFNTEEVYLSQAIISDEGVEFRNNFEIGDCKMQKADLQLMKVKPE